MSDVYPPTGPTGAALPAMLPAPPPPKAEVVVLAVLAQTGGSHLGETAGVAGLLLAAGVLLVLVARRWRDG